MESMSEPQLIFTGCKFCWKARKAFDIYIVLHGGCKAYELVSYERTLQQESHRIYLDSAVLATKVKNKTGGKQGKSSTTAEADYNKLVVDYVLARLLLQEFVIEEQKFTTRWHYLPGDQDDEQSRSLIIAKPPLLFPYQPKYFSPTIPEIVQVLLNHPKHEIYREKNCSTTRRTIQERWRGPLILCKVKHGRHLSARDARSFRRLQLNLPTEEDVARMEKILKVNPMKLQPQASSRGLAAPPLKDRAQSIVRANSMRGKNLTTGASTNAPAKLKRGNSKQGKMMKQPSARGKGKHISHLHGGAGEGEDAEEEDGFGDSPESTGAIGTMLAGLAALSRSVKESFSFKGRSSKVGASADQRAYLPETEGTPMAITPADSKVLHGSDLLDADCAAGGQEQGPGKGLSESKKGLLNSLLQGMQWGSSKKVLPAT